MEKPNLNYIKEISGGDTEFEKEMIGVVKMEFPLEKDVYKQNILADNKIAIAEIVHKIKHKFSILGLEESYEIAMDYEENLRDGNYQLKEEFEEVLVTITTFLASL
ncbi:Hpt domain-containing protein [Wenyingzhuangia sp. IMCC45574]